MIYQSIEQDVSQILKIRPDMFTELHNMQINDWSVMEPMFMISRQNAVDIQHDHLVISGQTRSSLRGLRFGPLLWEREGFGEDWELGQASPREAEPEDSLPEGYLEYPLFWDIDYDTPSDLSKLDVNTLFTTSE